MSKKNTNCYLCQNDVIWIDYTDPEFLSYYLTEFSQIKPREKTGICRFHSNKVKKAIKKARQIGVVK
jgi:small subunit ribosomal protein S18